jgi:hypothetical protein
VLARIFWEKIECFCKERVVRSAALAIVISSVVAAIRA